ncbi:TetR/AcrR family transcriptional regulator [Streptomyces sp. NPDC048441]|uniref:TetR/AcrR family transcriptional regulator n=1 Tax=Streptomyces sp. NPDC048441 TaxID=3365552 RepID=UPI00371E1B68
MARDGVDVGHIVKGVRGRPRSEAVERSITEGVLKLIEDGVPLADLSIERIARTAGVGKATIYRRWSGKEELFVDILRGMDEPAPDLAGDSMRDDLITCLDQLRRRGVNLRSSALLHNVFAQMKSLPKLWEAYQATVIEPQRRVVIGVLRRGVENGELRADVDIVLANDLFVGPMLVRTLLRSDAPLDKDLAEQIVDTVLDGLRPTG